ncbi:MAG: hypothetical protein WA919_17975 [Coleofasciculaceae cyanobacterium]
MAAKLLSSEGCIHAEVQFSVTKSGFQSYLNWERNTVESEESYRPLLIFQEKLTIGVARSAATP